MKKNNQTGLQKYTSSEVRRVDAPDNIPLTGVPSSGAVFIALLHNVKIRVVEICGKVLKWISSLGTTVKALLAAAALTGIIVFGFGFSYGLNIIKFNGDLEQVDSTSAGNEKKKPLKKKKKSRSNKTNPKIAKQGVKTAKKKQIPRNNAPLDPKVVTSSNSKRYVDRYLKVAQAEMRKYGIPASITLAQGILESKYGTSPMATTINNHFGIKCHIRNCAGRGTYHCKNYHDDDRDDHFRIYKNPEESFRSHSLVLLQDRYQKRLNGKNDYVTWAWALRNGGYATEPEYAVRLIEIIKRDKLFIYDKM